MDLEIFEKRENENNREYAYRLLRTNIMTLRLKPGTVLNEAELSKQLNMSRTPIHEAITTLKEEWLVEVVPQSGTKVTLIDPVLMKEGYSARILLESDLLKDFAGKLRHSQSQKLLECLQKQEKAGQNLENDPDLFIRLDDEFHSMLYSFSTRSYTWKALRRLVSHYDRARYLDAMTGNSNSEKLLNEHREFYNYMLMGVPDDVSTLDKITNHLTSFRGDFFDTIGSYRQYFRL